MEPMYQSFGTVGQVGPGPRVVALGGGHGLYATLSALRHLTAKLTAVVTVADDGGSSGRLREELGILPPGDLRMALSALCADSQWGHLWRDVLQYRFQSTGELDGHSVGNLLITALWDILADPVAGLDRVGALLGAQGRVLPMANEPLTISAEVEFEDGLQTVTGQVSVAKTKGRVRTVSVSPNNASVPQETLKAVHDAEYLVMGPGSWFSSLIPHLVVPELRTEICQTRAKKILVLNLEQQGDHDGGETTGMNQVDHLNALIHHAPELRFDAVLASAKLNEDYGALGRAVRDLGGKLFIRDIALRGQPGVHDPIRLAAAFTDIFDRFKAENHNS
ncbi:hypothetical protein BK816_04200 [Boudabousia tangfeifanii]|uniref:Putative gluconeogenesis factor n=1 Tax=Boudabousia tangfeifanii TaxID=1912795 RepID=A0A1D9MK86_9ACTO|nr:uridine diphosphate-N-acetylglucosamine-binding protein YvcK [Boudabousia tangfeifanii]AOZ72593.1 hypothetical protein BK816_04200 [Boudabousia tangfeifanii]